MRGLATATAFLIALAFEAGIAGAQTRIKDIVDFEGVRENLLIGYGLVVGLNGTGDDIGSAIFTRESLVGMLERLGVNARDDDLETDNVAAVMVTAILPAFPTQGTRIDVTISAIGDADSLLGVVSETDDGLMVMVFDEPFTGSGVVEAVQAWSNGQANYGWALWHAADNGWLVRTREDGTLANRPLLTVTYSAPPVATPTSTFTGA